MRLPVDDRPASGARPEWLEVAFGMLLLFAYLSASSAGLAILVHHLTPGG
jgi:hypothetical protein